MQCEEARTLLQGRADPEAEAHLEACPTCFEWLEERDPLVRVLRAAAPAPVAAPVMVTARVLARRRRRPYISWPLGLAAAGGLAFLAVLVLWIGIVSAPAAATAVFVEAGSAANTAATVLGALLAVPRALLLDQPLLLAVYLFLTVAICAVWVRLYQQIPVPRRVLQ